MSEFEGKLRPMVESDLDKVLAWRNHDNVRCFMFNSHTISADEHLQWFAKSLADQQRQLLIYEECSKPLGFVTLGKISVGSVAEWGFYVDPSAGRGTGTSLGKATIRYAFNELGFHKLWGQVIAFNQRSIQLHLKLGFSVEGRWKLHHFDGKNYHDVLFFGLIAREWRGKQGNMEGLNG